MVIMSTPGVNSFSTEIRVNKTDLDDAKHAEVVDVTTTESEKNCIPGIEEKEKYFCGDCYRHFRQSGSYRKHKQLYPFKHKYYECCKKIDDENNHVCHKKSSLRKTTKKKRLTNGSSGIEVPGSMNGEDKSDDHQSTYAIESNIKDVIPSTEPSDSEREESDAFNELFTKRKRPYKRKTPSQKLEEEKTKVFKCQDCSKSFNRHSSLLFHTKVVHEKQGNFKCQICEEEFSSKETYKSHVSMHGPEDKVICKGCKKVFDSLKLYHAHAKQNPGIHCFLCKLCLRKFPSELVLEQHVCICQNGKPLHCACGLEFTKYEDVIIHSKGTKPFHCCSCSHNAVSLTAYIRHLRKHSKQKPFQCSRCDMKFAIIDFLNIHMKREHKEENDDKIDTESISHSNNYKCSSCDEEFITPDDLKMHSYFHERVRCPDCGKLFHKNRLENHRNSHKKSASLCPECGKLFDARFKLTQHMITIHNAEPVKCEVCEKVLKTKKILNEHMKTHLKSEVGQRIPQAICPRCGVGLAQKGSLARHILLVHEKHKLVPCDKTYTCQECSEVLPNKGKYYSHRRMHRAMIDRFPCEICGRVFNKKQNLRRHIYLLHDEKRIIEKPMYDCLICGRSFREKKNLRRHYKMVHKLDDAMMG